MTAKQFWMLDEREVWHKPALAEARRRGWLANRISRGSQALGGYGFIRPHADPGVLELNQVDYMQMTAHCKMVQDPLQVYAYEDKSIQTKHFAAWMPQTWEAGCLTDALALLDVLPHEVMSKAHVGASSVNVRYLQGRAAIEKHIRQIFKYGIRVDHCSGGYMSTQKDYVYLQEFIPHTSTYRVNRIGDSYAVFLRHCYKDRPVAQTGNTTPVTKLTGDILLALDKAKDITDAIKSKWVALDLLWHEEVQEFKLLETSLAWPTGAFTDAMFYRFDADIAVVPAWWETGRTWADIWKVLFDELEAGIWG